MRSWAPSRAASSRAFSIAMTGRGNGLSRYFGRDLPFSTGIEES